MAAISSLGIGSGTLTSSVIDQLKAADVSQTITPITKQQQKISTKQSSLGELTALLSSLQSATSDLGTDTAYLKRTGTSSSTAVKITVDDGAQVQNSTINVSQLAQNDVIQSSGFASNSSVVTLKQGTLTVNLGTTSSYQIKVNTGTTLDQLAQMINDDTSGTVTASILNTGQATNPYKLILKSVSSGSTNAISVSEDGLSSPLGLATPSVSGSSTPSTSSGSVSAGDIKINGVSIGAFSTSSSDANVNASVIVSHINLQSATTGVTALTDTSGKIKLMSDGRQIDLQMSAGAQSMTGFASSSMFTSTQGLTGASSAFATGTTSLADGDIKINGVSLGAISLTSTNPETNAQSILSAINAKNSQTGVTATTDGAGKITLTSDDGTSNITLAQINGASSITGLTDDSTTTSITAGSATHGVATSSIADGDIKINGTSIGALTLTSSSAATNAKTIVDAINAIKTTTGVYASTDTTGKIQLNATDGKTISVVTANGAALKSGLASSDGTLTGTSSAKLQAAQDAKFTFDGISMTRSSNTISDVISGATLTLAKTSTIANDGDALISIAQDTTQMSTYANTFVTAFNTVSSKLQELTSYDTTANKGTTFTGVSEISSIYSNMSSILTTINPTTNSSLMDYGFALDKTGQLSVNSSTLTSKIAASSKDLEDLFKGTSKITDGNYTANNVASKQLGTVPSGGIMINGVSIPSVTSTSTTSAETNAQLFVTAINSQYSNTGVKAYTDGNGKLKLTNDTGGQIQLTTTSMAAQLSGLAASAGSTDPITSATVAYGKIDSRDGIFASLNNMLKTLYSNNDSTLTIFGNSLTTQMQNLTDQQTKAQASIDARYTVLTSRFALYDGMISKYQQQFSSLQQQIKSATSSN